MKVNDIPVTVVGPGSQDIGDAPLSYISYEFRWQRDRYRTYGLSFLDATHWYEFLAAYFE